MACNAMCRIISEFLVGPKLTKINHGENFYDYDIRLYVQWKPAAIMQWLEP